MTDQTTPRSTSRSIVIIGETLIDVIQRPDGSTSSRPGGSAANVALTLGRLGHQPTLLTCLGVDEYGQQLRDWLSASHVQLGAGQQSLPHTSTATAVLDRAGVATYTFDITWHLNTAPAAGTELVHTGSLAALLEPGADSVLAVILEQRPTATITYDPNIRAALVTDWTRTRERVERFVRLADVVKVSEEDLRWLYPESDPRSVVERWKASGPAVVILTMGGHGALGVFAGGSVMARGMDVSVVDTVGAGDAFMGSFIGQLVQVGLAGGGQREELRAIDQGLLHTMLRRSCDVAAITVTREGADPPYADELAVSSP